MKLEEAKAAGYCVVSRRHREAARIDRKDWKEEMAKRHSPWDPAGEGMRWIQDLGDKSAADFYRRIHSRDTITFPASWLGKLPSSQDGSAEYREKHARTTKPNPAREQGIRDGNSRIPSAG